MTHDTGHCPDQGPDSLLGVGAVPAARPVVVPAVASHPRESPGQ